MTESVAVASANDLNPGDMEMVEVDDLEILIANVDGDLLATGARCTHYGGPLADGEMTEDEIGRAHV